MTPNEEITENFIDSRKILASKGISAPKIVALLLNRLLHTKQINKYLYRHRNKEGAEFAQAILNELNITVNLHNANRIPSDGNPIIVANHPLGGPDGMALIAAVGNIRNDIKFPVNDFLMHLPTLRNVFVPVNKVNGNRSSASGIRTAFSDSNALLYFPAGICSRRINGRIMDLEWKPTFIKQAIANHRDIIPVYIEAHNRRRFYFLANLRKKLGIKFSFEMALLPAEMFAQQGNTINMYVGKPIPWQDLMDNQTPLEWARQLHDRVYLLKNE